MSNGLLRLFDVATNSLTKNIIWLTCVSVLLSTVLVSSINYFRLQEIVIDSATEKLAGQTRLIAQRFMSSYDQLETDVQVLSLMPPIQGIIRSAPAGIDPLDGSSMETWRERLSTIFLSVMTARPHYFQIRFIGIGDHGKEIVRVHRVPFGVDVVPSSQLQSKENETYFQNALKTTVPGVHFSDVTLNRENNKLDPDLIPTIRAITPVFDHQNNLFGFIVVNANYDLMLRTTLNSGLPEHDTIVFDKNGDYVIYEKNRILGQFVLPENDQRNIPDFLQDIIDIDAPSSITFFEDAIYYSIRAPITAGYPDAFLGVVLKTPYDEIMGPVFRTRSVSLIVSFLLVFACLLLSLVMARKFAEPIVKMTTDIKNTDSEHQLPDLPIDRNDEFGELARAFDRRTRDLAESRKRTRAILDNIVDGIVTVDESGRIETFTPSSERIFGYTAGEAIGQNVRMLMPESASNEDDDDVSWNVGNGKCRRIAETRELSGRRKDGGVFPMELSVSELVFDDRRILIGTIRDISERKEVEILKDEFISTVNHEIRTPLTNIQASLSLLKKMASIGADPKSEALLQLSYRNCIRLSHLIADILDLDRMNAGRLNYKLEEAELGEIIRQTVDLQRKEAESFGVTVSVVDSDGDVYANIDTERFGHALANLLSNAAKFSPEGAKVVVTLSVEDHRTVRVSVRDSGCGIPASFHDKMFDKFAQADGSASRAKGGSGLGLTVTKTIIESMDGAVEFETEEGKGSTFALVLPLVSAPEATETAASGARG